ncbi:MAG TPA: hypothetical protein VED40_01770 [Azospirillaceae bacterium]|nr:hypothetical protein [Azospirillaceae bacterium]
MNREGDPRGVPGSGSDQPFQSGTPREGGRDDSYRQPDGADSLRSRDMYDRGGFRDKIAVSDPATSPLGTDSEASGFPHPEGSLDVPPPGSNPADDLTTVPPSVGSVAAPQPIGNPHHGIGGGTVTGQEAGMVRNTGAHDHHASKVGTYSTAGTSAGAGPDGSDHSLGGRVPTMGATNAPATSRGAGGIIAAVVVLALIAAAIWYLMAGGTPAEIVPPAPPAGG